MSKLIVKEVSSKWQMWQGKGQEPASAKFAALASAMEKEGYSLHSFQAFGVSATGAGGETWVVETVIGVFQRDRLEEIRKEWEKKYTPPTRRVE